MNKYLKKSRLGPTPSFSKLNPGFTLIELLVVVLIIGILAAVALPQYTKSVERARMAEKIVIVKALQQAQKRYFLEKGTWSTSLEELDIDIPAGFTPSAGKNFFYDDKNVILTHNGTMCMGWCTSSSTSLNQDYSIVSSNEEGKYNTLSCTNTTSCLFCVGHTAKGEKICTMSGSLLSKNASGHNTYELK